MSVRQTPPPETPTHNLHFFAVQSGSATIAVVRLAVLFVAPENEITPGWVAFTRGPYNRQREPSPSRWRPCRSCRASAFAIRLKVALARATIAGGIVRAG